MVSRKPARSPAPTPHDADVLQQAIRARSGLRPRLGPRRSRPSTIFVDDGKPVARCTPLGAGHYGLSFHNHAGRWEPMPIIAPLPRLADALVGVLAPYLQRWDFPDTKSESHH